MLTALGPRLGAFYSEKSPKTRLARIYSYGSTLPGAIIGDGDRN